MEKRTLVKSGVSSFIVALPVGWIRRNKLDKGDEVTIDENEKGDLVIQAEKEMSIPTTYYTIKVREDNQETIYWELLKAYLHNYSTVNIEGENISSMSPKVLQNIKDFIGLDIIEQTKDTIVLKNFSSYDTETSPYSLLKKMDVGIRSMFDMIRIFYSKSFHQEDVLELTAQHEYNDRVYLFTIKIINSILDSPQLMKVFKTDYRQLTKEHIMVNSLKQVSFYFNQIGKLLLFIEKKDSSLIKEIVETLDKKYRTIITLPKSSLSKELMLALQESERYANKLESALKTIKNPSLIEIISYSLTLNNLLDQLAIEIMS